MGKKLKMWMDIFTGIIFVGAFFLFITYFGDDIFGEAQLTLILVGVPVFLVLAVAYLLYKFFKKRKAAVQEAQV